MYELQPPLVHTQLFRKREEETSNMEWLAVSWRRESLPGAHNEQKESQNDQNPFKPEQKCTEEKHYLHVYVLGMILVLSSKDTQENSNKVKIDHKIH